MNRRRFLRTAGFALLAGAAARAGARPGSGPALLGCARRGGVDVVAGLRAGGGTTFVRALPGRGHAIVRRPGSDEALVVARRPGTFIVRIDAHTGEPTGDALASAPGRHFYGHGAFTADGRYLLTTENAFESGAGVLGVRDAAGGYRLLAEIPSGGVGPHALVPLPDGRGVIVANGGLRTHPDTGRALLNLDSMRPNVAVVDVDSGRLRECIELGARYHRLSLRHLDLAADGRLAVAAQHHGSRRDSVPAVLLVEDGRARTLDHDHPAVRAMRQYAGSVAFDAAGEYVAATSPRGSRLVVWACATGAVAGAARIDDACGLATAGGAGGWFVTTGRGELLRASVGGDGVRLAHLAHWDEVHWDNHLAA